MWFPITFSIAFSLGIMGYAIIYCVEKNVEAFSFFLKTKQSKKNLYMITALNLCYFGLCCTLLFFNILKF